MDASEYIVLIPESLEEVSAYSKDIELREVEYGVQTRVLALASGPKSDRLALIRDNPQSFDAQHSAAIEIQRTYRSYRARCRLLRILHENTSNIAPYGQSRAYSERVLDVPSPSEEKHVARQKLEEGYNNYINQLIASGVDPSSLEILSFNEFCADSIKSWWPKSRQSTRELPASTPINKAIPAPTRMTPAKGQHEGQMGQNTASTVIQKAWRRHIDVQVYRYYRDLINFKNRGDPAMMLRCINPQEAKLLDAASGIHIKFRLAGDRFPPNIYYKIFTHRPIQDLCANSPKDYTSADTKRKLAHDIHNKSNRVPKKTMSGWYQRWENNGWRLVSDRLIHHILSDPVTWDTSKKKIDFHHNRLHRKEDVERKRKQKKIDWMRKMYHEGMLKAKVEDEETIGLIEGAAAGMVATIEQHGSGAVQDWEVNELLDWTTSLNFEEYLDAWKEIATSANSEKPVYDRMELASAGIDPYEFTLSGANRPSSTRQSHNTPSSSHAGSIIGIP